MQRIIVFFGVAFTFFNAAFVYLLCTAHFLSNPAYQAIVKRGGKHTLAVEICRKRCTKAPLDMGYDGSGRWL